MIIKSLSRKTPSFQGLLNYLLKEHDAPAPPGLERFIYTKNVKGTQAEIIQLFEQNESYRIRPHKNQNYLYHEIISFDNRDTTAIKTETLKDLAREYAKRRGDALYVIVPHYSQEHIHLHVMISGCEYQTGKAMRLSRTSFAEIKRELQEIQKTKYPELSHSIVEHGKKERNQISDREHQFTKRTGKLSERQHLKSITQKCLEIASTREELKSLLKEEGITIYERNGRLQGILTQHGRKHRFSKLELGEQVKALEQYQSKEQELFESMARIRHQRKKWDKDHERN